MGSVTFILPAGERKAITVKPGNTVMEAAVAGEVPGIEAQCYGAGICGTCHVYALGVSGALLPPVSDWERSMLDNIELADGTSRLACQIRFTEELDGAEFRVPERQDAVS
jgi:2Fe-2S ferredoxin